MHIAHIVLLSAKKPLSNRLGLRHIPPFLRSRFISTQARRLPPLSQDRNHSRFSRFPPSGPRLRGPRNPLTSATQRPLFPPSPKTPMAQQLSNQQAEWKKCNQAFGLAAKGEGGSKEGTLFRFRCMVITQPTRNIHNT